MTVDHGSPDPVYRQLAGIIRARIESGEYPPRAVVPSITRLAAEHQLAEMTVRKALDVLKSEGVLISVPGKGTYVK